MSGPQGISNFPSQHCSEASDNISGFYQRDSCFTCLHNPDNRNQHLLKKKRKRKQYIEGSSSMLGSNFLSSDQMVNFTHVGEMKSVGCLFFCGGHCGVILSYPVLRPISPMKLHHSWCMCQFFCELLSTLSPSVATYCFTEKH